MSQSYRSEPEHKIAERNMLRDSDGEIKLPHISQRKPAPGDIHPLDKITVQKILRKTPVKYLYGLRGIELRGREGKRGSLSWGQPLGHYLPTEKTIRLYSIPIHGTIEGAALNEVRAEFNSYAKYGYEPELNKTENKIEYRWPDNIGLGLWFTQVLFHELGHHFVEQYRYKNSRIKGRDEEELVANLHKSRLFREEILCILKGDN